MSREVPICGQQNPQIPLKFKTLSQKRNTNSLGSILFLQEVHTHLGLEHVCAVWFAYKGHCQTIILLVTMLQVACPSLVNNSLRASYIPLFPA